MRDLDSEWAVKHPPKSQDERSFRWCGITVVRLPEMPISAFDEIENAPSPNGDGEPQRRNDMRAIIEATRKCLDPTCHADFDAVANSGSLTVERLMNLWEVLVSETMGRPTQRPATSSSGPSESGTPSTAGPSTTGEWTSGGLVPGASPT